eukprot:gene8910-18144_t
MSTMSFPRPDRSAHGHRVASQVMNSVVHSRFRNLLPEDQISARDHQSIDDA